MDISQEKIWTVVELSSFEYIDTVGKDDSPIFFLQEITFGSTK